jgi:hypothetical protein
VGFRKLDEHQIRLLSVLLYFCLPIKEGGAMATQSFEEEVPEEPIPAMQQLLDNPFLLLFIGIAMPTVLYIVWGVMEIVSLPIAK